MDVPILIINKTINKTLIRFASTGKNLQIN